MNNALKGAAALLFLAVANGGAAAETGVSNNQIVLGVIDPVTGPPSLLGKAHALSLKVWAADVNARGGINGRKIKMVVEDDGYVPARSLQALKKLIEVDKIFALVGTSGSAQLAAMIPLINKEGLPAINTVAVNSYQFNPPRKTLFVIGPTYCQEMTAGISWLVENRNLKKAKFALFIQDDEYGDDVRCGYLAAVKKYGLNNVVELKFKRGQKDFSAEVLKARAAKANVFISGGVIIGNANIMKEARRNRMKITFLATHVAHLAVVQALAGVASEGYYTADYVPDLTSLKTPGVKKFMELANKYLTAKEVKRLNRYSLVGYVGMLAFEHAAKQCGRDLTRTCLIKKMEGLKNFKTGGLMSPITFGKGVRHAVTDMIMLQSKTAERRFVRVSGFIKVK